MSVAPLPTILPAMRMDKAKADPLIIAWNIPFLNIVSDINTKMNVQKAAVTGPYSKYRRIEIEFVRERYAYFLRGTGRKRNKSTAKKKIYRVYERIIPLSDVNMIRKIKYNKI